MCIYIVYVYIPSPKSGNPPFSQNFLTGSPGNEITFCHNLTSRVLLSQMSQQHLTSKRRGLQGFSSGMAFLCAGSDINACREDGSEAKIRKRKVVQNLKQAVFRAHAHVLWQGDANSLHSLGLFALCRKRERKTSKVPQSRHVAKND